MLAWFVFLAARIGYPVCLALVLKNNPPRYYLLCLAPLIGGLLIAIGFVLPGSGFLVFIPGTYANEMTLIGFVTLITEPTGVGFSVLLAYHRIWEKGEGLAN